MSVETMLPVLISQLEGGRSLNIYGLMHHEAEQYENGELFDENVFGPFNDCCCCCCWW